MGRSFGADGGSAAKASRGDATTSLSKKTVRKCIDRISVCAILQGGEGENGQE